MSNETPETSTPDQAPRQDRSYLDALGRESDSRTQTNSQVKTPLSVLKGHIISTHTARLSFLAAMAIGGLGTGVKMLADTAATGKGAEARAELLTALPEGTQLSQKDLTDLNCIVSRAARACESVAGTDAFEEANCDTNALDQMRDSQGEDMAITGYSQGAKKIAAKTGIEPLLECKGPATDKVLDIDVITLPGTTPKATEAPEAQGETFKIEIQLMPENLPQGYQIF